MNILKFFNTQEERELLYKTCCTGCETEECRYKLITPPNRLLSFQVVTTNLGANVQEFQITQLGGTDYILPNSLIIKKQYVGKDYFIYEGDFHNLTLPCGYYTARVLLDNADVFYSDYFYIVGRQISEQILPLANTKFPFGWTLTGVWTDTINGYCAAGAATATITVPQIISGNRYQLSLSINNYTGGTPASVSFGGGSAVSIPFGANSADVQAVAGSNNLLVISVPVGTNICITNVNLFELSDNEGNCYNYLRWRNCSSINGTTYNSTNYNSEFYVESESKVYNVTPKTTEEVSKDIYGNETTTFKRIEYERSLFLGRMPPHIAQALSEMMAHDTVYLSEQYVGSYDKLAKYSVEINTNTDTNGCLVDVELTFQKYDAIVINSCCDDDLILLEPETCLFEAIINFSPLVGVLKSIHLGNPNVESVHLINLPMMDEQPINTALSALPYGTNWNYKVLNNSTAIISAHFAKPLTPNVAGGSLNRIKYDNGFGDKFFDTITQSCCVAYKELVSAESLVTMTDFTNENNYFINSTCTCVAPYRMFQFMPEYYRVDGVVYLDIANGIINMPYLIDMSTVPMPCPDNDTYLTIDAGTPVLQPIVTEDFKVSGVNWIKNFCDVINAINPLVQFHDNFTAYTKALPTTDFELRMSCVVNCCVGAINYNGGRGTVLISSKNQFDPNILPFGGNTYMQAYKDCV